MQMMMLATIAVAMMTVIWVRISVALLPKRQATFLTRVYRTLFHHGLNVVGCSTCSNDAVLLL